MSRMHRTRMLLLGLLLACNSAWAEELEPRALAALDQMGAYLRSLQQFRIDAASQAAPANISGLLDQLSERYAIELPLADLFRWHPGTAKEVGVSSALLIAASTPAATSTPG